MNLAIQNKYLQTRVQTAIPEQLLLMLIDGAIKFCKLGIEAIKKQDLAEANKNLIRTQDIVTELNITLDRNMEISHQLSRLYDYFNQRLIEANMTKEVEPAEEVLEHLKQLKETWMEAALSIKKQQSARSPQTGVNYG